MPKVSHKPIRTCLGCRRRDEKSSLVRIASHAGRVVPDPDARLPGRGGYLHPRAECLEAFVKAKVREFHSLKRRVDREARFELAKMMTLLLAPGARVE